MPLEPPLAGTIAYTFMLYFTVYYIIIAAYT